MVIDFSDDNIQEYHLDNDPSNDTFKEFMSHEKPDWVACRWIAVNGLSWYVKTGLNYHESVNLSSGCAQREYPIGAGNSLPVESM